MTAYPTQIPDHAAPSSTHGEESTALTGLVTEDLPLTVEVPPIALMEGNTIVRHPADGADVEWKITALAVDADGVEIEYRTREGKTGSFMFSSPDSWVRVEVGQVLT